ncbi:carboxymuconolactone decarboxylase family protein [Ramlibacter henchirensis]|uniref:Carboxymuconolactone decarboxylase family protein n=1 Tax=Ramlibacter henchirensis TaxID=204072 RepID=A0A4Z0C5Y0_9BURK|nr:carboxymuconolactone decarboxylase family protein [Ramlibacter henchirensis]TFZ06681.1 carboxymuconolactone decarboxylase family protein [Ramlibacter henchirensis]
MPDSPPVPEALRQGSAQPWRERMPLPPMESMTPQQRAAAQALIDGPRKGVFGPFLPLMRSPVLLERVGKVGEYLRFESALEARVRELVTCAAARHVGNQFEWHVHAPLAVKAGVDAGAIDVLRQGARPTSGLKEDEALALDFAMELLRTNGSSEPTYERAVRGFGEQGVVELTTLVGYFVMVNWLMNVAHTPAQASAGDALTPFPL